MDQSVKVDPHSKELKKELDLRGYTVGDVIANGCYSTIYKAKKGNRDVALKIIDLQTVTENYRKKYIPRELKLILKVKHNNIIETIEVVTEPGRFVLILMACAPSDLEVEIKKRGKIEEQQLRMWLVGIAQAVNYLHSLNYVHRDIKPNHVLIISETQAALSCFSSSKLMLNQTDLTKSSCGTVYYMAPEVTLDEIAQKTQASYKIALG